MVVDMPPSDAYEGQGAKGGHGSLLQLACVLGDRPSVQSLLVAGLRIDDDSSNGFGTALHCACATAQVEVLWDLLSHPSGKSVVNRQALGAGRELPLQLAVSSNAGARSIATCKLLIDARASLGESSGVAGGGHAHTALMRAVCKDRLEIAEWLLEAYPDASHGAPAELLRLCPRGPAVVQLLVERLGVSANAIAMHLVTDGRSHPRRLLALQTALELRADPSAQDASGMTALQSAQRPPVDVAALALFEVAAPGNLAPSTLLAHVQAHPSKAAAPPRGGGGKAGKQPRSRHSTTQGKRLSGAKIEEQMDFNIQFP